MRRDRLTIGLAFLLAFSLGLGARPSAPLVHDDGRMRGSANAPVTLIEYSDFTCGYCMKFFRDTWPRLRAKYVDTGKVRFLYRDYPRSDRGAGLEAAIAARCAGEQGQYWAMHDRLFTTGGKLSSSTLLEDARALGLAQPAFTECLQAGRYTKAIFQDREDGIRNFGFHGTPGFVLLRTEAGSSEEPIVIPGAFPYEIFEEQIDELLARTGGKGKG
jgi:protein-disulfide isomerase